MATLLEENFVNNVITIESSLEISVLELAQRMLKVTNSNSKIGHLPTLSDGDMTSRQPFKLKILIRSG